MVRMLDDETRWFFAGEHKRMSMLREELIGAQSSAKRYEAARTADMKRLRSELDGLRGNLDARVTALTGAFLSFVELDSIREQLSHFPEHARARRWAANALQELVDGALPEPHPDVPGYWIIPAVSALLPDGTVDDALVAQAMKRDEEATRLFLVAARAALGRGSAVAHQLPELMVTADGVWSPEQLMLWASALRGAFGDDALPALMPLVDEELAKADDKDWRDWLISRSGMVDIVPGIRWLTEKLEAVTPRPQEDEQTAWRRPRPVGAPDFLSPDGRADEQVEVGEEVLEAVDLADAWPDTRELLISLAERLIALGASDERALLERAEELRSELNPAKLSPQAAKQEEDEEPPAVEPLAAVAAVRSTALDEHASPRDSRLLRRAVAKQFQSFALELSTVGTPEKPSVQVVGHNTVKATPNGIDRAALQEAERSIERDTAPPPDAALAMPLLIGGAVAVILGVALALSSGWWLLVSIGGGIAIYMGWLRRAEAQEYAELRTQRLDKLRYAAESAVSKAKKLYERQREDYETNRQIAGRFLTALEASERA